jgi:hypothetical protein
MGNSFLAFGDWLLAKAKSQSPKAKRPRTSFLDHSMKLVFVSRGDERLKGVVFAAGRRNIELQRAKSPLAMGAEVEQERIATPLFYLFRLLLVG